MAKKKQGLGWIEWLRGWMYVIYEMLFQRITASHLHNPLELPPLSDLTCIVTGSTSGIGREIARQLAEAGAHVVMAVRNPKAAHELINQWSASWHGLPLNIEVMQLDLLSLDSVVTFANAWNARLAPLHVLINNAGIFSIGGSSVFWISLIFGTQKMEIYISTCYMQDPRNFQRMGLRNICKSIIWLLHCSQYCFCHPLLEDLQVESLMSILL